jgi:RNA polymerase sigma-70 factor (ECF subfamily)
VIADRILEALPSLRRFASSLTRTSDEAEDLVQETVAKALAGEGGFDGGNLRAWLFTIMKNHRVNVVRKEARRKEMEGMVSVSSCGVWASVRPSDPDSGIEGREVRRAMGSLSPTHRRIIQRIADGHSYKELAAEDGVPLGTIMSRLHRARAGFATGAP